MVSSWTAERSREDMVAAGEEYNIQQLEALAVLHEITREGSYAREGARITWGLDNQSDLYGLVKGGISSNRPLRATIQAIVTRRLAIDWRWVASARNIADILTRKKWKNFKGTCPLAKEVVRDVKIEQWEKIKHTAETAPVRGNTESKSNALFIDEMRKILQQGSIKKNHVH